MRQRKGIMDERSDAFLALPGGIGTLEELVEVWTSRSLNMHHKPVVVLDPWGDYDHLHALLDHWQERGFVRSGRDRPRALGHRHRPRPSTRSRVPGRRAPVGGGSGCARRIRGGMSP